MKMLLKLADQDQISEFKQSLKEGDVLISVPHSRDLARRAFVEMPQGTRFAHAAIYNGGGQVIEISRTRGAHKITLDEFLDKNHAIALRPSVSQKQRRKALERARDLVGAPYSLTRGAKTIMGFDDEVDEDELEEVAKDKGVICSSVAGYAYQMLDFKKSPLNVLPSDLLKHPKFKKITQSFEDRPDYDKDLSSMGFSMK